MLPEAALKTPLLVPPPANMSVPPLTLTEPLLLHTPLIDTVPESTSNVAPEATISVPIDDVWPRLPMTKVPAVMLSCPLQFMLLTVLEMADVTVMDALLMTASSLGPGTPGRLVVVL